MKKIVPVSIALFIRNVSETGFELWMQKRIDSDSLLHGKFEFPGGKIELQESSLEAMKREIFEEVDYQFKKNKIKALRIYPYDYGEKVICLYPFLIFEEQPSEEKGAWFKLSYLEKSKPLQNMIPQANIPLIDDVCRYINELNQFQVLDYLWKS
jgi:8-oxo-dGTP diphosphatase